MLHIQRTNYKRGFVGLASLIGVTFLLIATVIGVTVVKNRGITLNPNKMAEDVYPTPTGSGCSGSCYYGSSACSSLGLQNGTGSCPGGLCCGSPLTNNCTNGDSYCVDSNTVAVCKVDKSGYTETDCAGGSMCDSAQKKCVSSNAPTPTPTPGSGSTACVGQCFWGISACSTVSRYPSSGTCQGTSICCGDVFSANNCTNGDSYCVDSNTVAVCKVDKSGYTNTDCAAGSKCDSTLKKCTGGGDCAATNQSCTNRSCCNSSDVCQPLPGGKFCVSAGSECTSGQTKCQAEGLTSYVYKCGTGGYWEKERACDAGCEGNFCKKACDPGEKRCSGDELEICNSTGTAWVGQSCVNGCQTTGGTAACKVAANPSLYTSYAYTPPTPSDEYIAGTTACINDPEGDACKEWNKPQLTEAAIVGTTLLLAPLAVPEIGAAAFAYGTAALTTLPASIQTVAAVAGTVAGYAGVTAGTVACATNPYSEACIAYIAGIQGDPTALIQLANSADDLINSAFANSMSKSLSWGDDFLSSPDDTQGVVYSNIVYHDGNATEIIDWPANKYLKEMTGLDLDSSLLNDVLARDSRIVKTKYGIPSSELNFNNPHEYRNQLYKLAKENDIDILSSNQTTFFDDCSVAGGVCFDAGEVFAKTTIIAKENDNAVIYNRTLTHELVHGLQNKKYQSMPIEVREYEAYLSEWNPTKLENFTPADLNYLTSVYMLRSVNHWYEEAGTVSPFTLLP